MSGFVAGRPGCNQVVHSGAYTTYAWAHNFFAVTGVLLCTAVLITWLYLHLTNPSRGEETE